MLPPPCQPSTAPATLLLAGWFLIITLLGIRTIIQVGLRRSGILTPFLLLMVTLETVFLLAMTVQHITR